MTIFLRGNRFVVQVYDPDFGRSRQVGTFDTEEEARHAQSHPEEFLRPPRECDVESGAHSVYRAYDAAGELLYIGITNGGPRRLGGHARSSEWWPLVATVRIEHAESRCHALWLEEKAIWDEQPQFNIQHNQGRDAA
jgi:hypothetical protein